MPTVSWSKKTVKKPTRSGVKVEMVEIIREKCSQLAAIAEDLKGVSGETFRWKSGEEFDQTKQTKQKRNKLMFWVKQKLLVNGYFWSRNFFSVSNVFLFHLWSINGND